MAASVLEIYHVSLPPSPGSVVAPCGEERLGGQAEEKASLGRPRSLAPPLLIACLCPQSPTVGTPASKV